MVSECGGRRVEDLRGVGAGSEGGGLRVGELEEVGLLDDFWGDDFARPAPRGEAVDHHGAFLAEGFFVFGHAVVEEEVLADVCTRYVERADMVASQRERERLASCAENSCQALPHGVQRSGFRLKTAATYLLIL